MAHDPNAQFDQALLAMIEHSPVGAVPHTPAYQDGLRRLSAARQVYPDADHKDGHVTARSLAQQTSFHASNLNALREGPIEIEALEPNAAVFDRYVQSLPASLRARAESHRAVVAGRPAQHRSKHDGVIVHDPLHTLFLVPGAGPHAGISGNYLYGFVVEASQAQAPAAWSIHLHDSEDGAVHFDAPNLSEALAKLQEVFDSAPFHMSELEALGFCFV